MNNLFLRLGYGLVIILMLIVSCGKDEVQSLTPVFVFKHNINGTQLQTGLMKYVNLAGNTYEVDELQYFISEIKLKTADGRTIPILSDSAIHYIDLDIPSTLRWSPADLIPAVDYDSISFVFGINEAKNKTGLFVNPPERDMFWPDMMGGGYHYMKMNGKWIAPGDVTKAFNFHLGIGMGEMGMFYQNYFTVTLPMKIRVEGLYNEFYIIMNVDKWFEAPNLWDWNVTGGQIMQNQSAMRKACENGANVFQVAHSAGLND